MLEFSKEMLVIFGRIVTILPLLLLVTLFMGKRAIGELPVIDFLIIVILGALVGADIADPNIHHLPTALAIIMIGIFQRIIANWQLSNRKVGRLLTFEPTVVVQNGKLIYKNIKKIRYSIDNILRMLRQKNVFDINEVETAVIEANGTMSVLKKPQKQTVTLADMDIHSTLSTLALPVIVEGTIYKDVLNNLDLNETWLKQELMNQGVQNIYDVFYASINRNHQLHVSFKRDHNIKVPPIKH